MGLFRALLGLGEKFQGNRRIMGALTSLSDLPAASGCEADMFEGWLTRTPHLAELHLPFDSLLIAVNSTPASLV